MNEYRRETSFQTNRRASRTGLPVRDAGVTGTISERRNINIEAMTATYETAFIAKSQAVPSGPINSAANAGPNTREPVITVVFSDMAFEISAGSTNSVTNPRRDGLSIALATPRMSDNV